MAAYSTTIPTHTIKEASQRRREESCYVKDELFANCLQFEIHLLP